MKYPIFETFHTFQGEGVFMGMRAFFIRLYGCPIHCHWCDSAGTWHPEYTPEHIHRKTADELVKEVVESGSYLVVLTGGEPAIHNLTELVDRLHERSIGVNVETSGAFSIKGDVDWVTLSPKRGKEPLEETILKADEFKFIIEAPEDIEFYTQTIIEKTSPGLNLSETPIWLHPEWSHRNDPAVLQAICQAVKSCHPEIVYRAGYQLHKLFQVDVLDKRSRELVPLGGDSKKGN